MSNFFVISELEFAMAVIYSVLVMTKQKQNFQIAWDLEIVILR